METWYRPQPTCFHLRSVNSNLGASICEALSLADQGEAFSCSTPTQLWEQLYFMRVQVCLNLCMKKTLWSLRLDPLRFCFPSEVDYSIHFWFQDQGTQDDLKRGNARKNFPLRPIWTLGISGFLSCAAQESRSSFLFQMLDLAVLMLNHIQTRAFLEKVPLRRAYSYGFGGLQSVDELSASKASNQVRTPSSMHWVLWASLSSFICAHQG